MATSPVTQSKEPSEASVASVGQTTPRIAIFIVAYNAEATLAKVLMRIPEQVMAKVDEIFVFDDASQDNTFRVGQSLQEDSLAPWSGKLVVHRHPINLMYGGNQRHGYLYAMERNFDIVVLLHGDGQYAPEVMQELLMPLESGAADMVMGSRMLVPGAARRGNMPLYKLIGNRILTGIENVLVGTRFSEFHSGYRAYSVAALREVPLHRMTTNWHFDTQIILEFVRRGFRVTEVSIPTYYGDEICHVNGIPYALHCIGEALRFALMRHAAKRVTRQVPLPEIAHTSRAMSQLRSERKRSSNNARRRTR
jgi:glycosyltransferase involved in cell wall biosynthesis